MSFFIGEDQRRDIEREIAEIQKKLEGKSVNPFLLRAALKAINNGRFGELVQTFPSYQKASDLLPREEEIVEEEDEKRIALTDIQFIELPSRGGEFWRNDLLEMGGLGLIEARRILQSTRRIIPERVIAGARILFPGTITKNAIQNCGGYFHVPMLKCPPRSINWSIGWQTFYSGGGVGRYYTRLHTESWWFLACAKKS